MAAALVLSACSALAGLDEINAISARSQALLAQDKLAEAIPLAEQVVQMSRAQLGAETRATAIFENRLGYLYYKVGRYDDAEKLLERAIAGHQTAEQKPFTAAINDLGLVYRATGRYSLAEQMLLQALAQHTSRFGPNHQYVALAATNLGLLYRDMGRYEDSEAKIKQGLAIREKSGSGGGRALSHSLINLAALYRDQGRYREAEALARRAVEVRKESSAPSDVASAMSILADILRRMGRYEESEQLLKSSLDIRKKAYGAEHPVVAATLNSLGNVYEGQGKLQDAESAYKAALAMRTRLLKPRFPDHPDLATSQANLGALYKAQRRYTDAEPLLRSALAIREKALARDHPHYVGSLIQLGDLLRASGRPEEAKSFFDRALAARKGAIRQFNILYGTNRKRITQAGSLNFGSEKADTLSFGAVNVWVQSELTSDVVKSSIPISAQPVDAAPADETTEVGRLVIRDKSATAESELLQWSASTLKEAQLFPRQALVFIHGFNMSFDNAAKRAAQLSYDIRFDGPVFIFSWPSRGVDSTIGSVLRSLNYTYDYSSAETAAEYLRRFLLDVMGRLDVDKVHLIAHSMGNMPLLGALRRVADAKALAQIRAGEIIFAAPDVRRDLFQQTTGELSALASRMTLYASRSDKALLASRLFWQGPPAGYVPNGQDPLIAPNVETIDISAAGDSLMGLNHDIYASNPDISHDLHEILARSMHPPDARMENFERKAAGGSAYWLYRRLQPPRSEARSR